MRGIDGGTHREQSNNRQKSYLIRGNQVFFFQPWISAILAVGVGSLLPAEGSDDVNKSPVVLDPSSRSSGFLLFLLLFLDLGSLTLDLASTSQRAVDFSSQQAGCHFNGGKLTKAAGSQRLVLDKWRAIEVENLVLNLVDAFKLANVIS